MSDLSMSVPSLLVPLGGLSLVLPNAAVAEIVDYRAPEAVAGSSDWLMGIITWRGMQIPLVAFEALVDKPVPGTDGRLRVAILNTLNSDANLPFIGVLLRGIPRLFKADHGSVANTNDEGRDHEAVLKHVLVNGEPAVIPDIDAMQRMLNDAPASV